MDQLTEQAISMLRRDGRASYSELARRLGTTRANIARRLSPLFDSGRLNVVAALHPSLFGLDVLARLGVRAEGPIDPLVEAIRALDAPAFISEVSGGTQIVIEMHLADLDELRRDVTTIRSMPGVIDVDVLIYERLIHSFFLLGGEPTIGPDEIDEIDLRLMELLQLDGRLGFAELGEAVGLSLSGCRARVQRLVDSGAMRIGAIMQRDDAHDAGLMFGFGFSSVGDRDELIALLRAHPGTDFLASAIGRYELLATVVFTTVREFRELLEAVRAVTGVGVVEQWLHIRVREERYHHSLRRIRHARASLG
ncbi:Lrp/AsnC family transcriptional regulator [Agromyces sp. NPDC058104]|uniref:Lrp/AsnC family transcriptional regulator n=1 Tax=Agromyces sp. NPDC058104 TaxID=3346342 RepID=UPI0036DAC4A5